MPILGSSISPNFSRLRQVRKPSVRSPMGVVVAHNRAAAMTGARVLKSGGSAADAAVATAFVLGVLEPWMSGIGGVGAGLVLEARSGKVTVIDFGGRAPAALDPADFPVVGSADSDLFGWPLVKDNRNTVGARAVVAPGLTAGLGLLHASFGRLPWQMLVEPAVAAAEEGLAVDWHTLLVIAGAIRDLERDAAAASVFLPGGAPPQVGTAASARPVVRLPMPALARTLQAIAEGGAGVLYKGEIARRIADDVRAMGGYLSEADLEACVPLARAPLEVGYRGRTVHLVAELNGGPTVAAALAHHLARRPAAEATPGGATFSAYAGALKAAWRDRLKRMGEAGERSHPTSTTHLSVVDRDGNVVTLTLTLLSLFGARFMLPQAGFLMNNGINWFDPVPGGPNSIAPGRRVLANYAPAIMTGGGSVVGIGGSGGRKIIPAVYQLLSLIADFGLDLETAFATPRIDVSGPVTVVADRRMPAATIEALAREHDVVMAEPVVYGNPFTVASAVLRRDGMNEGASEPEHPWSDAVSEEDV
jgi:gamma-glutamyltranspeptidase/glutathione hydrolase